MGKGCYDTTVTEGYGMRILIAEDDRDLNEVITAKLKSEHYSTDNCFNGQDARDYLESADYDAAILDIMMPKMDGITVLRTIRREGNSVPVLFLTAKDSIKDRVTGLDAGADDYLIKPFDINELLARIRVMVRKRDHNKTDLFSCDDLTLCVSTHEVFRGSEKIALSGKEYALLEYLIRNKGTVLSKEAIQQHVWSYDFEGDEDIIKVYIRYLRKKIDENHERKLIHTVRSYGYVLKEEAPGDE